VATNLPSNSKKPSKRSRSRCPCFRKSEPGEQVAITCWSLFSVRRSVFCWSVDFTSMKWEAIWYIFLGRL
jgi:hypothetical protein